MDATEIISLNAWTQEFISPVSTQYAELARILQFNATQPQKQPVRDALEALKKSQRNVPLHQLSSKQIALLSSLAVLPLLGEQGVTHIKNTLSSSDYDPASAAQDVQSDVAKLNSFAQSLNAASSALHEIGFRSDRPDALTDRALVTVTFKDRAAIENVADLKSWSAEWYDILRGICICVDEPPESVKVVGASTGSIVLFLSTTVLVTSLLALVAKNVASIAKEIISIDLARQSLLQQKILTQTIRNDLESQRQKVLDGGAERVMLELKKELPRPINGEEDTALQKAIDKFIKFSDAGGDMDLIAPRKLDESADDSQATVAKQISRLNQEIADLRSTKIEIQLLSDRSGDESAS